MKKHLLLAISLTILLHQVVLASTPLQTDASAEEYAVYSAVIVNMFTGDRVSFDSQAKIKLLVIQDQTNTNEIGDSDKDVQYFKRLFPTVTAEIVNDYWVRNTTTTQLKDSFDLKLNHVLVKKQEIQKMFNGVGDWTEFYKRYPDSGGFIILSHVGFDAVMNRALVYMAHWCGGLCGSGHYMLLEKSSDGWRVTGQKMVWIS